jgi:hypothetical protein
MTMKCVAPIFAAVAFLATTGSASSDESTQARALVTASGSSVSASQAALPTPRQIGEIADWISANMDLPASVLQPRLELATGAKLMALRYPGLSKRHPGIHAKYHGKMLLEVESNLLAVYDRSSQTIYLSAGWTGSTPAEMSILVHEMVHHLQNVGNVHYECAAAQERPAYIAQDRWLKRFGQDLETTFEVDMFTIFVKSGCVW